MPSLVTPPEMPEAVVEAIETMGNRARTEILRELANRGPLTRKELDHASGGSPSLTNLHLAALEEAGLVVADTPRGDRSRRTVRWSVVDEAVAQLPHTWLGYVLGETGDETE